MKFRTLHSSTTVILGSLLVIASICLGACRKPAAAPFDTTLYKQLIEKWRSDRLAGLKKEDGWLSLVGLFWLNEGPNKFGSNSSNAVVLPKDKAPGLAGTLKLDQGHVKLEAQSGAQITIDGKPVTSTELKDDNDDHGATVFKLGTLIMNIVKRGERIGVRIKDTESRTRQEFKGLDYFPIDPKWRVEARFEPYQPAKLIPITNVLGLTDNESSPGALAFDIDGKTYRIDPITEKGETDYFVMIADETTGGETYGAGRYLYVSPPDGNGKVIVDFNKAYSPPCAFTNFATCPLPPRQNHLPFRVEAGEKSRGH